jgi:hypothetical protein
LDNQQMTQAQPKTGKEMQQMRRKRNFWVLGLIFGFCVLIYLVTILRMEG